MRELSNGRGLDDVALWLLSIPGCEGWSSPETAEGAMATVYELDNEQAYEAEISQCVGVTGYHHWFFLSALADRTIMSFRRLPSILLASVSGSCPFFSGAADLYRLRTSFRSVALAR